MSGRIKPMDKVPTPELALPYAAPKLAKIVANVMPLDPKTMCRVIKVVIKVMVIITIKVLIGSFCESLLFLQSVLPLPARFLTVLICRGRWLCNKVPLSHPRQPKYALCSTQLRIT